MRYNLKRAYANAIEVLSDEALVEVLAKGPRVGKKKIKEVMLRFALYVLNTVENERNRTQLTG